MSAYCADKVQSYAVEVTLSEGECFKVVSASLGKERYYEKVVGQHVKTNFFEYMETMYKNIDYRTTSDKNKYIPLEFNTPTSLEDQYLYYFRYIDLYMGEYLKKETGKQPSNYSRLSKFVDDNSLFFDCIDSTELNILKNELNSLRNQYVHEGYYLPNNQFEVKENKQFKYYKTIDRSWLYKIVQAFKIGTYKILYTEILSLDVNEEKLKNALKCWF